MYAFGPHYTALYPLYVAIVGLSAFALVMVSLSLDISAFYGHLRDQLPTRWIIAPFGAIVSLAPVWLAMMMSAIRAGTPSPFATIHVLDLAFVFPTLIVAAVGLWQHRPWTYALAGPLLILGTTMMGSLVVSEVIAAVRFTPSICRSRSPFLSLRWPPACSPVVTCVFSPSEATVRVSGTSRLSNW